MKKKVVILIIFICLILVSVLTYLYVKKYKTNENFTLDSGLFVDPTKCGTYTLGKCLECANCGWCMDSFSSKCVSGDAYGPTTGTCQKWYHNDPFGRALLSADNDYRSATDLPMFE